MGYIINEPIVISYTEISFHDSMIGTAKMTVNKKEYYLVTIKKNAVAISYRNFLQAGNAIQVALGMPFAIHDEFMAPSMTKMKKLVSVNELTHIGIYVEKENFEWIYDYEQSMRSINDKNR